MAINPAFRVCKPSSIAYTGTGSAAVIRSNGSVAFDTCTALSLNGVFTSSYDNYMITMRSSSNTAGAGINGRLRSAGTDSTATTDYNFQALQASSTVISAVRSTTAGFWTLAENDDDYHNGFTMYLFGPYLAQPTALRNVTVDSTSGALLLDVAGTHELSTAYDGLTIYPDNGTFTGLVTVIGFYQ